MIDFSRSVQHPFQDREWAKKLGLGALINLVPILSFANAGFMIAHLRNVARGQDLPLPDWNNLSQYFTDGLKQFVVTLVYASPLLLLTCVMYGALFAVGLAGSDGTGRDMEEALERGMEQLGPAFVCLACLITLISLVYSFLSPAITIQFARTGSISASFRFNEVLDLIRRNPRDYILAFIVPAGVVLVLSVVLGVLLIIPIIGVVLYCLAIPVFIAATSYIYVVLAHIYGQLARGLFDGTVTPSPPPPAPPMLPLA